MTVVPCNGCTACCRSGVLVLHATLGDDPTAYETELIGGEVLVLKRKPDGSCIYLGDKGCTIWGRQPALCKMFDCRIYAKTKWATMPLPFGDPEVVKEAMKR